MFASRRPIGIGAAKKSLTDFLRKCRIGDDSSAPGSEFSAAARDALDLQLSGLLQMDSKKFWESVAAASSLHGLLDNYLRSLYRFFDTCGLEYAAKRLGVSTAEDDLANQICLFLHRIISDENSDDNSIDCLDSQQHRALLLETKWLDLPMLMDISVLFRNELARKMVANAIILQPNVMDDLAIGLSYFLDTANSFCHLCLESFEVLASSPGLETGIRDQLLSKLEEVEDVIIDGIVTMDHFINAYKPAAIFLSRPSELSNEEDLLNLLARMHGTIVPLYRQEEFSISWRSIRLCDDICSLGRNLLSTCYLSDDAFRKSFDGQPIKKLFPALMDDPASRGDVVFRTLVKVNEEEVAALVEAGYHTKEHVTFLKSLEIRCGLLSRIRTLCEKGWLFLDDGQLNELSKMMLPPSIKPGYFDDDEESELQKSLEDEEVAL